MTWLLGGCGWFGAAALLAPIVGRVIRTRDERETPVRPVDGPEPELCSLGCPCANGSARGHSGGVRMGSGPRR